MSDEGVNLSHIDGKLEAMAARDQRRKWEERAWFFVGTIIMALLTVIGADMRGDVKGNSSSVARIDGRLIAVETKLEFIAPAVANPRGLARAEQAGAPVPDSVQDLAESGAPQ